MKKNISIILSCTLAIVLIGGSILAIHNHFFSPSPTAHDTTEVMHSAVPATQTNLNQKTNSASLSATASQSPTPENIESSNSTAPATTPPLDQTQSSAYSLHKNITATVFWVGEPVGNGSSEDNSISAWDDDWEKDYGGYDDYINRNGYFPAQFTPKQNPFYLDLPYDDFDDNGNRRPNAYQVVPWANSQTWAPTESMMKNRWVKIIKDGAVCYGQIEDSGPYVYNDYQYVFGTAAPASQEANNAGMDVSPALRDCLGFNGLNNDENKVDWQFVAASEVPPGPWKEIVTTSQINWH